MKIVAFADVHNQWESVDVPNADVLICAGDIGLRTDATDIIAFNKWLGDLPHTHKIVIGGNHDFILADSNVGRGFYLTNAIYLEDSGCEIDGVKFWGSPYAPAFGPWVFMKNRGNEIAKHWGLIPNDIDVLITHGPPYNILDKESRGEHCGCWDLKQAIEKIKPKIHIFGHIHESYGYLKGTDTSFFNVSLLNEQYNLVNKPVILEIK